MQPDSGQRLKAQDIQEELSQREGGLLLWQTVTENLKRTGKQPGSSTREMSCRDGKTADSEPEQGDGREAENEDYHVRRAWRRKRDPG